jgi:hypothetical protein
MQKFNDRAGGQPESAEIDQTIAQPGMLFHVLPPLFLNLLRPGRLHSCDALGDNRED